MESNPQKQHDGHDEQRMHDGHVRVDENSKQRNLEPYRENPKGEYLTTNEGVRIPHTDDSLKAGERGPVLMEDHHFREKITHFDHERIPERVVHARGSAAHGYFQVYESMAEYTKANFLRDPAAKTPVFVRFSNVVGSRGSADTVRDVRGFATKFYTSDGVYDLVGNNMPVFFIQDAIKFPDLIHAAKPEPNSEIPQAATAHDTAWDFFSLVPESTHMTLWLLSDRALPRSFAMMEGFGVHTFRFVNDQGKARFVKFHWKPLLGVHSLVWDESQKLAGKDPDWLRRDLWESIEKGNYPEYELGVQMLDEDDEFAYDFDLLDATKIWPEEMIPVRRIGKMTLNRNPDDFFAETEQVAFHIGNLVPGIDVTDDPLLQGRLFSYIDTQLLRLGGPNFEEIPINRSVAPVHNNQRDGFSRQTISQARTSYYPNSLSGNYPHPAPEKEHGYVNYPEMVSGRKVRARSESFRDHFSQARLFWMSMSPAEQRHIIDAGRFELGKVKSKEVRERMVALYNQVDHGLAARIAEGIGVTPPAQTQSLYDAQAGARQAGQITQTEQATRSTTNGRKHTIERSPALSMENTVKNTIKGRRIAILVADGVNEGELQAVKQAFEQRGASTFVIAKVLGTMKAMGGQQIPVDKSAPTTDAAMYDAVYVPGGPQSVEQLQRDGDAMHFILESYKHSKPIGATGAGIRLLEHVHLPVLVAAGPTSNQGINNTNGVVTAQNTDNLNGFIDQFITAVAQHRHWMRPQLEQIPA